MFFKEKIKNNAEKEKVNKLDASFDDILKKEEELIFLLKNGNFNKSFISMSLLKIEFLLKDTNSIIKLIDETSCDEKVKKVYMLTIEDLIKRLTELKVFLLKTKEKFELSNAIKTNAEQQEFLNNIKKFERKNI